MNNTKALTDVDISTSFDNIFANNSGTVRQINKATLFEALESAEDYQALKSEVNTLQESVNGIDTTTDTTLTKTGKAADAKITGDKLAALKEKDDAVDAEIGSLKESLSNKITKFYASNEGKNHLADSDNGKIMDMMLYGKSEQFTTTGKNLIKIKDGTQTTRGVTVTAKDGVLALKGIATGTGWAIIDIDSFVLDGTCILSSNVATNIKASVANKSYEQVLEQSKSKTLENAEISKVCFNINEGKTYDVSNILIQIEKGSVATSYEPYTDQSVQLPYTLNAIPVTSGGNVTIDGQQYIADYVDAERGKLVRMVDSSKLDNTQSIVNKTEWLLAEPQEIQLTQEEVQTLKTLATYYPTTNIFINSEQLDGYTVFNYPISMADGWNYVKKQLNDNRDYIYDMDTQSAEAYVNSEYAVALTELEVM